MQKNTQKIIFTQQQNNVHLKNSCVGFYPAGSEPHLSPGGIHRLSFYQIIRSLVIGNHQKEKNHQNWSQLVLSGTIHLPGGPMM